MTKSNDLFYDYEIEREQVLFSGLPLIAQSLFDPRQGFRETPLRDHKGSALEIRHTETFSVGKNMFTDSSPWNTYGWPTPHGIRLAIMVADRLREQQLLPDIFISAPSLRTRLTTAIIKKD